MSTSGAALGGAIVVMGAVVDTTKPRADEVGLTFESVSSNAVSWNAMAAPKIQVEKAK